MYFDKEIDYFIGGADSFFTSSSKKGENCYTWARKKLLASDDNLIKQQLMPTFTDWIAALPRWKLVTQQTSPSWDKSSFAFFSVCGVVVAGLGMYVYSRNRI